MSRTKAKQEFWKDIMYIPATQKGVDSDILLFSYGFYMTLSCAERRKGHNPLYEEDLINDYLFVWGREKMMGLDPLMTREK